ncbi:MAG: hypothetical protein M3069_29885 [Chloroflexota bacterium]|nr:hypothetical protein [Chloroflexota bacterium]
MADAIVTLLLNTRANVLNVHPHRFRHDTARRLVESVDLPTVAARLGHRAAGHRADLQPA